MSNLESIVEIKNVFPNIVAIKRLDVSKLKIVGDKFEKSFESRLQTTIFDKTLLDNKG